MVGHLGDVNHTILVVGQVDECAEVHQADNLAIVDFADFRLLNDGFDHLLGNRSIRCLDGRNGDNAVVVDVDLCTRFGNDLLDHAAALADDFTDLVRVDLHGGHLGRPVGYVRARLGDRLEHDLVQNAITGNAALLKRLLDDVRSQAIDLDVDLDGGDTLLGTSDLKVHIAVEVLDALDIGEGGFLAAVGNQAARDTGNRCLDRHASIHQSQGRTADRALRGRTVGRNNFRNQTQCVREFLDARDNRQQRTFCQRTMADLTTARAAGRAGFADREGREVIMMDITLFLFFKDGVELLRIAQGAQSTQGQHLGLATGEHTRTVYARQDANFGSQRTDFFHAAAIDALAIGQPAANDLLLQLVYALGQIGAVLFQIRFVQGFLEGVDDLAHARVANGLVVGVHRHFEFVVALCLELVEQVVVDVVMFILELRLADFVLDALDKGTDLLDLLMRFHEGVEHVVLGHFLGAGFDHDDFILGGAQGHVHFADLALLAGRVDNDLAVYDADLAAANDVVERNVRNGNRDGRTQQSDDLGRVVIVVLEHRADDGNVIAEVLREQRTHRAVDLAGCQDGLFARTALTTHERTRDAANRIQALFKVDREREEIDAVARLGRCGRGDEHSGLAVTNQARAIGELCHFAGFNSQLPACKGGFKHAVVFEIKMVDIAHNCLLFVFSWPGVPGGRNGKPTVFST